MEFDWLKAFCYVTPLRVMLQEADTVPELLRKKLASTPATLLARNNIAKVDTRCNSAISSSVPTFRVRIRKINERKSLPFQVLFQ